ncbi:uncharacterized protein LTR77_008488 [Saxophila tyrrhenica]|uniref:Uncharacterized protein n=1 Tax=Saxophila tyrrhenica TaxID=1690608 RepID=A0AAV9P415_9PEZI|nr:hypothetical protein LTR77_008488 [Saxophila tyrrhenica]
MPENRRKYKRPSPASKPSFSTPVETSNNAAEPDATTPKPAPSENASRPPMMPTAATTPSALHTDDSKPAPDSSLPTPNSSNPVPSNLPIPPPTCKTFHFPPAPSGAQDLNHLAALSFLTSITSSPGHFDRGHLVASAFETIPSTPELASYVRLCAAALTAVLDLVAWDHLREVLGGCMEEVVGICGWVGEFEMVKKEVRGGRGVWEDVNGTKQVEAELKELDDCLSLLRTSSSDPSHYASLTAPASRALTAYMQSPAYTQLLCDYQTIDAPTP